MKANLFDICYDTDGEDIDGLPPYLVMEVPSEIKTMREANDWVWQEGADYISDHTGWCVKGFNFDVVR
jgi:hypothetical protein